MNIKKCDYKVIRQTGSHIRLTSILKGKEHNITIPGHKDLKVRSKTVISAGYLTV